MKKINQRLRIGLTAIVGLGFFATIGTVFAHTTSPTSPTNKTALNSVNQKLVDQHGHRILQQAKTVQATKTINDFDFPEPEFVNSNGKLGEYNVRNIYNANGASLYYAKARSTNSVKLTSSSSTSSEPFDNLVLIGNNDNKVIWSVDAEKIKNTINTNRSSSSTSSPQSSSSSESNSATVAPVTTASISVRINKAEFSAAANAFFVSVFAKISDTQSHTAIIKITRDEGTVSVYHDAALETKSMSASNGTDYKTHEFNHLVIRVDGVNPTILMLTGVLNNQSGKNVIAAFSVSAGTLGTSGVFTSAASSDFTDTIKNAGGKLIITNSIFDNGALLLVYFVLSASSETTSNNPKIYSFSLRDNLLQNPQSTDLRAITNNSGEQTLFNVEKNSNGLFLIAKSTSGTKGDYASTSELVVSKVSASVDINNANVTLNTHANNVNYLAGLAPSGIAPINNGNNLLPGAAYVTVNANHVLVALKNDFSYLQQITLINSIPSGVKILNISNNGVYYLIHLSNGQIIAYDNNGFVGYADKLNLALETVASVSFIPQSEINDGARYTTQKFDEFKTSFEANSSSFFVRGNPYNNRTYQPVYEYEFEKGTAPADANYGEEATVNVFQKLRKLGTNGLPNTSDTTGIKYFVGSYKYQLYTKEASVKIKNVVRPFVLKSLPTDVAAFYNLQDNRQVAIDDFLEIKNVNLNDKYTSLNNVAITFRGSNNPSRLTINVTVGYAWRNNAKVNSTTFNVTFQGFQDTKNLLQEFSYTLNPKTIETLNPAFSRIFPSDLQPDQVIDEFIQLSDELKRYNYVVDIIPKNTTGSAILTITFDFRGENVVLAPANITDGTLVTHNSVTWETLSVFKADPNYNENFLFGFSTFEEIKQKTLKDDSGKVAVLLQPSDLVKKFRTSDGSQEKDITEKVKVAIDELGLFVASPIVRRWITQINITDVNDLLGSFKLEVVLSQPLPGSLTTKFSHNFNGFARRAATNADIFTVTFLEDKEAYVNEFAPLEDENLFNLLPSQVLAEDLLQRANDVLSKQNQIQGGLITLSQAAEEAKPIISLSADNPKGNLLVSLYFESFLSYNPTTSQITLLRNQKISRVYSGFKTGDPVDNSTGYFINWKSINDVVLKNGNLKIDQLTANQFHEYLRQLNSYQIAELFANLSFAATEKYSANPNLISTNLAVDNNRGTITVTLNFEQWNQRGGITSFVQEFSGFLIPENAWNEAVAEFDPFNGLDPNDPSFAQAKSVTPADQASAEILANFYSFSNSVFNNVEKEIYFLFNTNTGTGQIHFFVKTPKLAAASTTSSTTDPVDNNNNAAPTAPQTPADPNDQTNSNGSTSPADSTDQSNSTPSPDPTVPSTQPTPPTPTTPANAPAAPATTLVHQVQTKIIRMDDATKTDDTDTDQSKTKTFNTQVIPYRSLSQRGFVELAKSGQVISGFKELQLYPSFTNSIIYILLAIFLPTVLIGPAIYVFHRLRRKYMVAYYENKLKKRLEKEFGTHS
ncbi:hypothetical protein [Mycoplasmoides fastidiosum]|nr:hypothetical protein [Mycoplasmoides fastidiosum]UUD37989.1 hypothetical protein NPA10_01165 [Mycoplasmoides fastidiosum]